MTHATTHTRIDGPLVMVGFGSIGKGTLPLILRHIDIARDRMMIIDPDDSARSIADFAGVRFEKLALQPDTLQQTLAPLLVPGDFLLNVSVEVSSVALTELCRANGALYLDTCIEPWPGGYTDPTLPPSLRIQLCAAQSRAGVARGTAGQGADRGSDAWRQSRHGLASGQAGAAQHRRRYRARRRQAGRPRRMGRARRAARRHGRSISPSATRRSRRTRRRPGEFVNTWSIDGFCQRGLAAGRARLGHAMSATSRPDGGRHDFGCGARDLSEPAGRRDAGAQLDAARRPLSRLPDHPRRVDLDRRLSDRARRRAGALPPDLPLRLPSLRRRGADAA